MSSGQPNAYQYQGLSGANSGWSGLLGSLGGLFGQAQNNPYFGQELSGAQNVAGQGTGIGQSFINQGLQLPGQYGSALSNASSLFGQGNQLYGEGQNLYGQAEGELPYAQRILNQSFDPQSLLYNKTLNQSTDQTNAQLAGSGLLNSPFGASVQSANNQNFNIDWQNNKLGREQSGLQSYQSALGGVGSAIGTGVGGLGAEGSALGSQLNALGGYGSALGNAQNLSSGGLSTIAGTSSLPSQDYLGNISSLFGLGGQLGNQYGSFLNEGLGYQNSASNIAQQNFLDQSAGLGGLFQALGWGFGSGSGGGGFNNIASLFGL